MFLGGVKRRGKGGATKLLKNNLDFLAGGG
jgi:hypothetical protein